MASIHLDNVSISFAVLSASARSLKRVVLTTGVGGRIGRDEDDHVVVEALTNVSIDIEHGESIGLIGHNGSGKSTLLRVMAGIYEAHHGVISVSGKVAPLLDASMGLDPEMSGFENIILRGLYLGMNRAKMESHIDEIAAFTELGPYLDMPLRTYSAGMQTRLAFAVSTSIEPEILLLDEGISAGDAAFYEKAEKHLDAFIKRAGILVLASHSEALIRRYCTKAILLEHGKVIRFGGVDDVFEYYNKNRHPN